MPSGDTTSNLPGFPAADPQLTIFLTQAWLVLMASSLRSWTRSGEIWARLLPSIERSVTEASGDPARLAEARAALIDEIRGSLRGLAELAADEARRVEGEIDVVVQRLWPSPAAERPDGYWRRWTVKP